MDSLQNYLLRLSDQLDRDGKVVCADAVDAVIKTASLQKVAQYVGVIGYVLKQNRAMGNCIRKKRAKSKAAMQEIVLDCLKEYQDGQDYQDTQWTSKYAQVINQEPQSFDVAHLFLLSSADSKINEHIKKIAETAGILQENGVNDNIFASVLEHLGIFRKLLLNDCKDTGAHVNFKFAAPQRNWWSRFWNPSELSWNPRSWSQSVRERGQDLDAIDELNAILNSLTKITRLSQKIKPLILQIQTQDDPLLKRLDPDNWSQTWNIIQQVKDVTMDPALADPVRALSSSMTEINQHIISIQDDMQTLRTREAILGREFGITQSGESQPYASTSVADEYAEFQSVLERLYANPLNRQAQWYAQKAHGRLWDKLRYVDRDADTNMQQWLKTPEQSDDLTKPDKQPTQSVIAPDQNYLAQLLPHMNSSGFRQKDVMTILRAIAGTFVEGSDARQTIIDFIHAIEQQQQNAAKESPILTEKSPPESENEPSSTYVDSLMGDFDDKAAGNDIRNTLIKLADLIDPVNSNVADLIDQFIQENKEEEFEFLLPNFSTPVKEYEVQN
jgi:hypothetical protein